MPPGDGPQSYTVTLLHGVADALVQWGRAAERIGFGTQFRGALQSLQTRLEHDPLDYGDPTHDHEHAGLNERWVMQPVFIVHFAVHQDSRQVFVRQVRLNPYSPLAKSEPSE